MIKSNRKQERASSEAREKNKRKKHRAAALMAAFAVCFAIILTACGSGLKISLSWKENSPVSRAASSESEPVSSGMETSSSAVSESPSEPSERSEAQPVHIALENAQKPLLVSVSLNDQTVTVFDGEDRIVCQFTCSTGVPGNDTPTGTFTISDRGKSFYNTSVQEGAYFWTRFDGSYLFHSLPFDSEENMIPEEADKLGTKASHGCVRLSLDDAKWIYENIPEGTKVIID